MNRLFAILILFAACFGARAQNLITSTWNFADFVLYPQGIRQVIIQPQSYGLFGSTNLSGQPLHFVTDTNGTLTVTNLVSGYPYVVTFVGAYTNSQITNFFPPWLSGPVNASSWLGTVTGLNFYPTNAILQITNLDGSAYAVTTNGVVTIGVSVSNQFSGVALTNLIGLNATNATNFTLFASNALYQQFIPGGGFTGFAVSNWIGILSTNSTNFTLQGLLLASNAFGVLSTNSTNFAYSLGANGTNFSQGVGTSLTNLINAISATLSNYAGILSTNGTNFASAQTQLASNFAGLLSTNSTNFAGTLSTNLTNDIVSTSNALFSFIGGGGFSGTALTNLIGLMSTNSTNFTLQVGQVISNWVGVLSTNSTNFTISQAQSSSNYAGVLSTNDTNWAASLLIASSNSVFSNVTANGVIAGNGGGLSNVAVIGPHWGNQIKIISVGANAQANASEGVGIDDGTNVSVLCATWTNGSGTTGGNIGLWQGPSIFSLTYQGIAIPPVAGAWDSNYVSGPRLFVANGFLWLYAFGSTNGQFEGVGSAIGVWYMPWPGLITPTSFTAATTNPIVPTVHPNGNLYRPDVVIDNNGLYHMFVNSNTVPGSEQINFLTSPSPSGPWTWSGIAPVIPTNNMGPSEIGSLRVGDLQAFRNGSNGWWGHLFGTSINFATPCDMYVTSPDLTNWSQLSFSQTGYYLNGVAPSPTIRGSVFWNRNGLPILLTDDVGSNGVYACFNLDLQQISYTNFYSHTGFAAPPTGTQIYPDIFSGPRAQPHDVIILDTGVSGADFHADNGKFQISTSGNPLQFYIGGSFNTPFSGTPSLTLNSTFNGMSNLFIGTNGIASFATNFQAQITTGFWTNTNAFNVLAIFTNGVTNLTVSNSAPFLIANNLTNSGVYAQHMGPKWIITNTSTSFTVVAE